MRIAQVQANLNVVTGTQDITSAGIGTPIGVIFQFSSAILNGTIVQGSILGFGAYDGTNSRSGSAFSQNASVTSSDTGGRSSSTNVLEICLPTGTGIDAQAAAVGFITDGIQINITNAPATSLIVNATFFLADFTGEAFSVTDLTPSATENATASITGQAFAPNFAFAFTGLIGTTYNNARIQRGYACNDNGTIRQGNSSYFESDSADPTSCDQEVSASYVQSIVGGAAYEVTAWTADGLTVTTRRAAAAQNIVFVLIKTLGRVWVGLPSIANSTTGDKDITDPGFPADVVGAIATSISGAVDTVVSDATAGHISVGIGTFRTSTQLVASFQSEDNAAAPVQDTRSVVESGAILRVLDNAGADECKAALVSALPGGFRINVSAENLSAATKSVWFAWSRPGDAHWPKLRHYFYRQSIRM